MKWTAEKLIAFEEKVASDFKAGKINCPCHLSGGNEEELLGIFDLIKKEDYVLSTHRNHYHYLLKGGDPLKLMNELYGKPTGVCKGKGRSMHIYDKSINFYTSGIVSGMCGVASGIGLAIKNTFKGKKRRPHVWCFVGDGAEDSGHFIESVRFCSSRALPVTFIIEDNDFAVDSTREMRWHNHQPIQASNIIRYDYFRQYPHVGCGEHVSF